MARYAVLVEDEAIVALDGCEYLFLSEVEELDHNGLRLVVIEGRHTGEAEPIQFGDAVEVRLLYPLGAECSRGCQRFCRRAGAFACFRDNVTFAVGTMTLCAGITVGYPGSIPSC